MKKYAKLTAILLMLSLITALSVSCAGIGDGALFDDIKTDGGTGIECRITAHDVNKNDVLDDISLTGREAEELLAYFTEAEYYETVESIMSPRSFSVSFYRYGENGESIPIYDSEDALNEFFVQDTDTVYQDTAYLGNLEGAYEKLFGYIIEKGSTGGYFCNITLDDRDGVYTRAQASGETVREMYELLETGEYITGLDRTDNEKAYVCLAFWGAEDATYYIYSDDYVEIFDSQSTTDLYKPIGMLEGIYQKALDMYLGTLRGVKEDEKAAGYKLNSLIILGSGAQVPTVSDFLDIDCIFVKELYASETATGDIAYNLILYFESCSIEELEEKVTILEAREDIGDAAKISVKNYDNPALD